MVTTYVDATPAVSVVIAIYAGIISYIIGTIFNDGFSTISFIKLPMEIESYPKALIVAFTV